MNRLLHSRSLKSLILWTLGIVCAASFVITAVALAAVIYRDQMQVWRERQSEAAAASSQTLTLFLDRARQTLVTIGGLEFDEQHELTEAMERLLYSDDSASLLEIARISKDGVILGSAGRTTPVLTELFAIRQSNWFSEARKGKLYLGPVQISAEGAPYLIVALPSEDEGVVAARLDMRILWEVVESIRFGASGGIYITDTRGRMLAHRDPAFVLANTSLRRRAEFAAFLGAQAQGGEPVWAGTYENFRGDPVAGVITRLGGTDWLVVTEVLTAEIYGTSERAVLVLALGMLLMGLLVIVIITPILNRVLFFPLEQVRSGAERIGNGHLDHTIAFRWTNELGELAAAFNEMAARLRNRDREIATHTDALAQAHEQALEASRLKSEFLATMSHEIRTPMNGIVGMADLLAATRLNQEQEEYTDIIRGSADALLIIINDILDLSKIEAGRLELQQGVFSVRRIVEEVVELLATAALARHLELNKLIAPDVPQRCQGDAARLRQVLLNLLGNAIKFTEKGGITLSVRGLAACDGPAQGSGSLRFEIHDTGIGIPQEQISRLFAPFTQVDGSYTRKYGGTGLGLAISKRLVELMGGEIGVESRWGEGSLFWFTVPLTAAAEDKGPEVTPRADSVAVTADPAGAAHVPPGESVGILLVEDNIVNQKVVLRQLQRLGYGATVAVNGREAVNACLHQHYHLILMDCQMPEMDGFEATRLIRAAESSGGAHTPIVAMTANAMAGDRELCLAAGMDDYLAKPLRIDELRDILTHWTACSV